MLELLMLTCKEIKNLLFIKSVNYVIGTILFMLYSLTIYSQKTSLSISTVNVEEAMKSMEVSNLSQFASKVRYIPLQTNDDLIISDITSCVFSRNHFLISSLKECWLFDINGNIVKKIGTQGRGPGEYQYVVNVGFDSQGKIYIQSLRDFFEYSSDGSFIKKYSNLFMFNKNLNDYFSKWIIIDDSLIFGHIPNRSGNSLIKALLINKSGNIIKRFQNYDLFKVAIKEVRTNPDNDAHIYLYKKSLCYKGPNDDTLFCLDNQFNLIPKYIFNLGKYKEPINARTIKYGQGPMNKYIYVLDVFQTENHLFINCQLGDHFPAKRLTPKTKKLPNGEVLNVWFNTNNALGIYDIKTRKMSFCKPTSTDNPLSTSGLYNDIDAGPRFFPKIQINDTTMVMWIDAKLFKEHISSNDFKKETPKFPEKKKELEKIANRISDFDNPVLMEVTFKK